MSSFFQTNPRCAEKLYQRVIDYVGTELPEGQVVLDLFCGTGTIGQLVARHTGCPVVRGTKWTATVWVHATPYRWTPPPEPRRPPGCDDADERCRGWSNTGECEKNPGFMLAKCPWSCRVTGCEH